MKRFHVVCWEAADVNGGLRASGPVEGDERGWTWYASDRPHTSFPIDRIGAGQGCEKPRSGLKDVDAERSQR